MISSKLGKLAVGTALFIEIYIIADYAPLRDEFHTILFTRIARALF